MSTTVNAEKKGVLIGSRWTPEHVWVRNTETGFFAERNPVLGMYDLMLQRGLLKRPVNRRDVAR